MGLRDVVEVASARPGKWIEGIRERKMQEAVQGCLGEWCYFLLRKGALGGERQVVIEGEDNDFGFNLKGVKQD